jgi:hypothetical protein
MRRTLAVLAVATAVLAAVAWPAAAKGEGPVGATITGPGLGSGHGPGGPSVPGGPGGSGGSGNGGSDRGTGGTAVGTVELRSRAGLEPIGNNPLWTLASFSGLVTTCSGGCQAYIDMTPPKDRASLGPAYRVVYYAGECCENAVRQVLYPFAPGGPWTFTTSDVGTDFFLLRHHTGWWHADRRMGTLFLRFLHHIGIPKVNPVAAPAAAAAGSAAEASGSAWRVPVGIAVLALLLVAGALAARPRRPAQVA